MNTVTGTFVVLPNFLFLDKQRLKLIDILIYAAIRWHEGTDYDYSFPSYERIAELTGCGRTFISKSITRLENAGRVVINHSTRKHHCNQYFFKREKGFEKLPKTFFSITDLTTSEKALLICLRQFFNHGWLTSLYKLKEFSGFLGLSYNQVYKPFKSLMAKGYITEKFRFNKAISTYNSWYTLTDKVAWQTGYRKPFNLNKPKHKLKLRIT